MAGTEEKTAVVSINGVILRKVRNPSGHYSLLLDMHFQGKRHRQYLGSRFLLTGDRDGDSQKLRLAKQIAARKAAELTENEHGLKPTASKNVDFLRYMATMASNKGKTWKSAIKQLKHFLKGRPLSLVAVTSSMAEDFKAYLLKNVSVNSARTYYGVFQTAIHQAVKTGILAKDPLLNVKSISLKRPLREFLTIDEIKKLESTPMDQEAIRNAFLFACFTGLRLSDVKALTWRNVTDNGLNIVQQKTQSALYLPLANTAKQYLPVRGLPDDSVFPLSQNDEHTRKHLKKWVARAGITKNISFHNARHSFASMLIEKEVSLYTVKELLGHSEIKNTQLYSHMVSKTKQDAVSKLDVD